MYSFCINFILGSTAWSHWLLHPNSRAGIARCVLPDVLLRYGTDGVVWFGPSWAGYSRLEQIKETLESYFSIIFSALRTELKPRVHHSSAPFSHCDLAFCQVCLCSPRRFPLLDLIFPFVVLPFPFSLPAPQPLCSPCHFLPHSGFWCT